MFNRNRTQSDWTQPDFTRERLKHQLEMQSQQIERVFSTHDFSARIDGGSVQKRSINFDLITPVSHGWERIRDLTYELRRILNVPDVELIREDGKLRLNIARPESPPVTLLDLFPLILDIPPVTAVLGLAENGRPVLLDFSDPDVTHVLLTGGQDSGKTTLLRTLVLSLALKNRQSRIQIILIDPGWGDDRSGYPILEPLSFLPHMLTGIGRQVEEAIEVLQFLNSEMAYRQQQQVRTPTIILVIDKAAKLLKISGAPVIDLLQPLLQHGAETGIQLILSTRRVDTAVWNNLLQAYLPVRIVGQVKNEHEASSAAGIGGTQADYLLGRGDFLAVVGGELTHFQGAFVDDYDLHLCLKDFQRNRPPPLLAQPVNIRPSVAPDGELFDTGSLKDQPFYYDGQNVSLDSYPTSDLEIDVDGRDVDDLNEFYVEDLE